MLESAKDELDSTGDEQIKLLIEKVNNIKRIKENVHDIIIILRKLLYIAEI